MRKYSHPVAIASLIAILCLSLAGSQVSAAPLSATPVGTSFTYQGQLKDGSGNPVNNTCDFQFSLYDALTGGNQIGSTQTALGVTVANGYFTVSLDFGSGAFGGDARWLEIAVRCPPDSSFTTLSPRQPLTPAPYSLYALNADYQDIVVVAKNGNSSGPIYDTVTDALNSITTASATNTFLIYVAPGTYTEQVTMKPWVDIEGSGELATKITFTGSGTMEAGTVIGENNCELRFLTVENTGGGGGWTTAIWNSGASPRLTHVTATASGGTSTFGVHNWQSSSPAMTNVTATVSGGSSDNNAVSNFYSSSPMMTNVTATASGAAGTTDYGVVNYTSSPMMTNVTATASGGTQSCGVENDASSSPTMTNVTATASGGRTSTWVCPTSTPR